jgi:hypothetical protein
MDVSEPRSPQIEVIGDITSVRRLLRLNSLLAPGVLGGTVADQSSSAEPLLIDS